MKPLLEEVKKALEERCIACFKGFQKHTIKDNALGLFRLKMQCFTDLFDTEEEVLEWLEDKGLI